MKYNMVDGHKIPSITKTKGFKPFWFAIGFICEYITLPIPFILYKIRYPKLDLIWKKAFAYDLLGLVLKQLLRYYIPAIF